MQLPLVSEITLFTGEPLTYKYRAFHVYFTKAVKLSLIQTKNILLHLTYKYHGKLFDLKPYTRTGILFSIEGLFVL